MAPDPPGRPEGSQTGRLGVPILSLIYPSPRGVAIHPLRDGATTLGRATDNDVVLGEGSVAEHHAVIIRDKDRVSLRDLLSGRTFVNEAPARGGELKPGDVVRLGEVRVRVAYSAPQAPAGPGVTPGSSSRPASAQAGAPRPATQVFQPTGSGRHVAASAGEPETPSRGTDSGARMARERDARRSKALSRVRQLSDEVLVESDIEGLLKRIAVGFVEIFDAERGVCLLLEEDGRNPLLTVEKRKDGSEEGTGVAREIIERSLQARTVVRIPPPGGDKRDPGGGFAAPLISGGKALGLLFFERGSLAAPFDGDDVHLMAIITNQVSLAVARLLS
jgi:hypothetical protein